MDIFFGKTANGTLDLSLADSDNWKDSNVLSLSISIGEDDFDAIYQSALKSKGLELSDTSGHYDFEKFDANRKSFISEFPQYPLIIGFEDMYQDYVLGPTETSKLLSECNCLMQVELTNKADLALRKLAYGCNAATISRHYLIFVCD